MRHPLPFLLAILSALAIASWQLWPAPLEARSTLVGNWFHPDNLSNVWLLEWVASQLRHGQSILHNDRYFWPVGDSPVLAGNGTEGVFYLLFRLVWGFPQALVAWALTVLTLNGLAGWALARAAGADRWSALVGLGATGASAYIVQELSSGRFTQVSAFWLLFFLASWLAFLARPRPWRAVLAGALLAATSFFYWYYGFFGVLAGAVLLAARLPELRRDRLAMPGIALLTVFSATFLLLIGPWAWTFGSAWASIPGTAEVTEFPHPQTLLEATRPHLPFLVAQGRHAGQAMPASVWVLGLGGALLALSRFRHDAVLRGVLITWLLFWGLALGPLFPGAPYNLLYSLADPLRRFWWPTRHVVVVNALWGALGAVALGTLSQRWPRLRGAVAGLALLTALSAGPLLQAQRAPYHPHLSTLTLPPPGYAELATLPDGVLVEPPLSPAAASTQQHLFYQIYHHKSLLSGHALWVQRTRPQAWDDFVAANSFLSELQRFERGELDGSFEFHGADLRALLDQDVRWFALNREYFAFHLRQLVKAYDGLFDQLFGKPIIREKGLQIWDGQRWSGRRQIDLQPWVWPTGVHPGGPEMPLVGRHPHSSVFSSRTDQPDG